MIRTLMMYTVVLACTFSRSLYAAPAQKTLWYNQIDVRMRIDTTGTITVTEYQTVTMNGPWNGIYRYFTTTGADSITLVQAGEVDHPYARGFIGDKYNYSVTDDRNGFKVMLRARNRHDRPFRYQQKKFVFTYIIHGAFHYAKRADILDWKVMFDRETEPVEKLTVRLHLPRHTEPVVFRTYSSAAEKPFRDGTDYVITASGISPKDQFRIRLDLPKNIVTGNMSARGHYHYNVKPFMYLFGLLAVLLILYTVWRCFGKDPSPAPAAGASPHLAGYPPGIVGILIDERFDQRDLAATMLDLCNRKYITIKQAETLSANGVAYLDYHITLRKDVTASDPHLRPFEMTLLRGLFNKNRTAGATCRLKKDIIDFGPYFTGIRRQAWEYVMTLDWFENYPPTRRKLITIIGVLLASVSALAAGRTNPDMLGALVLGALMSVGPGMVYLNRFRSIGNKVHAQYWFLIPPALLGIGVSLYGIISNYTGNAPAEDVAVLGYITGTLLCLTAPFMSKRTPLGVRIRNVYLQASTMIDELKATFDDYGDARWVIPLACALGVPDDVLNSLAAEVEAAGTPLGFPIRAGAHPGSASDSSLGDVFSDLNISIGSVTGSGSGGSGGGGAGGGGGGSGGGW